jgi:hypothetical protein
MNGHSNVALFICPHEILIDLQKESGGTERSSASFVALRPAGIKPAKVPSI